MTTATKAALLARRSELLGELSRMPKFKRGTAWHTDRVRALQRVQAQLAAR